MKWPVKWFLIFALLTGISYSIILPPFQSPDEVHHLYRSIHISQGNIEATLLKRERRLGGEIPIHYKKISDPFFRLRYNYSQKTTASEIKRVLSSSKSETTQFIDFPNVGYYPALSYLNHGMISFILKPFKLNGLFELYILRIFSIVLWIVVLFCCIKICPKYSLFFVVLGTLPATLSIHSGISTDVMTHSLAFLIFAYFFKMFNQKEWIKEEWIAFSSLALILAYTRPVFAPLALLGFFIGSMGSHKKYLLLNSFNIFLIATILVAQYYSLGDRFIPYDQYNDIYRDGKQLNPGVYPQHQLSLIFKEPITFLKVLFTSWWETKLATTAHYIGKFGWEANYIFAPIIAMLGTGVILILFGIEFNPSIRQRFFLIVIGILATTALSAVLYMQWEEVGASRITSLSGRYFIGILPIFFMSIIGLFKKIKIPAILIFLMWGAGWISGVYCIIERYYL